VVGKCFEVLDNGAQVELIAGAGEAQAHTFEPVVVFRWAKRISTFLRSLLDRSNSGVPFSDRA
jgi:aspartate ammonia-lyase